MTVGRNYQIGVLDLSTRHGEQVSKAPFDGVEPSWLPDGRHVVYTARTTGDQPGLHPGHGDRQEHAGEPLELRVGPPGQRLVALAIRPLRSSPRLVPIHHVPPGRDVVRPGSGNRGSRRVPTHPGR